MTSASGTNATAFTAVEFDPDRFRQRTFHDAVPGFISGAISPRDYLEDCLATVDEREPTVRAWAFIDPQEARAAADASTARYRAGNPISPIDGMPIGIKDLFNVKGMPTTLGIAGNNVVAGADTAPVQALRAAGAIILGKVHTSELGLNDLGPTRNGIDTRRAPGSSSGGSGAAVGARMVPATLGSQVGGSLIKPAAYNGNFGSKPTVGGLNRGDRLGYSHSTIGMQAGSLRDMWLATMEIAKRVGGDPGYPGVMGGNDLSAPIRPRRLILLETQGWDKCEGRTREAFEMFVANLRLAGVEIIGRRDSSLIEALESAQANLADECLRIIAWENRWNYMNLAEAMAFDYGPAFHKFVGIARNMDLQEYRLLLLKREHCRALMRTLAPLADGLITLSASGPAPLIEKPANPDPIVPYGTNGTSWFTYAASMLGVPAVTLPLIAVEKMPVGVQLLGQQNEDDRITGVARWIAETVTKVSL